MGKLDVKIALQKITIQLIFGRKLGMMARMITSILKVTTPTPCTNLFKGWNPQNCFLFSNISEPTANIKNIFQQKMFFIQFPAENILYSFP